MPRAKVCGLTRSADVRAAVDAGADAVGFVVDVDVETPRELTPDRAAELVQAVPPFVTSVLVTMPATAPEAVTLAEQVGVDAVQLHGVPAADVGVVVGGFHGPVIPAVSTDDVAEYAGVGHALLVDTPSEAGGGGTGRTHDWAATRAATADLDQPVILAGGLTPDNVADAIAATDPYAVDVASGVESSGGVKDHAALERFVDRATGAT